MKNKLFVLGLDGMPFSFIGTKYFNKFMPNLTSLCMEGKVKRMNSVYPVISSVAWTNYATGANPGEHGIYGFVDKENSPFRIIVPTSADRKRSTIWEALSLNKKVYSINVPLTYPPKPVSGKMISCFLCPTIEKLTYPVDYYKHLKDMNYTIDVDAWLVGINPVEMLRQIITAMQTRFKVAFEIMDEEDWDFIQLHIMETDRLMHFFFNYISQNLENIEQSYTDQFFKALDDNIGNLANRLGNQDKLLILSDHGMCKIDSEVQMNVWLEKEGLLHFTDIKNKRLEDYKENSVCYSLSPGRIYINLQGREDKGSVPKEQYNQVREDIKRRLLNMKYKGTEQLVMGKVMYREEVYRGERLDNAPDIIAHPVRGFDLKAALNENEVFTSSDLNGMHTYEDAMIAGINIDVSEINSIEQVYNLIMRNME